MKARKELSVSSLSTFLNCPRKFFYSHEKRWKPIVEAEQLTFGKAWHGLLEAWGKEGECFKDTLCNYLDLHEHEFVQTMKTDTFAMFIAMAWELGVQIAEIGKITTTEQGFNFRLPQSHWHIVGFIDAINADGHPIEYKTTSSDIEQDAFYWLRLKANLQAITYALAMDADRVRYVVFRKPRLSRKQLPLLDDDGNKIVTHLESGERAYNKNGTPRQSAGEGYKLETREETDDEFIARMREDLTATPFVVTREVAVSDEDKATVLSAFTSSVKQIELLRKRSTKDTREDTAWARNCTEFNCKNCPYQGICLDVNYDPAQGVPQGFEEVNK
jgi:CRISPR/Cas system-associated exonuclease Cas4 (RecB family)